MITFKQYLTEINWRGVELMKKVKTRGETPKQREERREHAKRAIANNFKRGFINKETHDRQMRDQDPSRPEENEDVDFPTDKNWRERYGDLDKPNRDKHLTDVDDDADFPTDKNWRERYGDLDKPKENEEGNFHTPDLVRLEKQVRDHLKNGDDYLAKRFAGYASTPEQRKYLRAIIRKDMRVANET